jgi:hypothetical protein
MQKTSVFLSSRLPRLGSESGGEGIVCRHLANVLSPKNCLIRKGLRIVFWSPPPAIMECPACAWLKTGCSRSGLGKYIPRVVDPARGDQCFSLGSQSRIRCQVPKVRWVFFSGHCTYFHFLIHKCLEKPVEQFDGMALRTDAGKHRYAK